MRTMFRLPWRLFKRPFSGRPASPVRRFARSNTHVLDASDKLEEETLPWYTQDGFYPVKIGEVFQSRYQVIGKLGFGGYSTVWLCRDHKQHKHVTIKVFERNSAEGKREVKVYDRLNNAFRTSHAGAMLSRTALDSFQVGSAEALYQCLVHQPLGISLHDLRTQFAAKVLPEELVKLTLLHLLLALDYLVIRLDLSRQDINVLCLLVEE